MADMPYEEMMRRLRRQMRALRAAAKANMVYAPSYLDDATAIEQAIKLLERIQPEHRNDALAGGDAYLRSLEEMHRG